MAGLIVSDRCVNPSGLTILFCILRHFVHIDSADTPAQVLYLFNFECFLKGFGNPND